MIVLIPAYEPDEKLVRLLELLAASDRGFNVVVVDDGSGPEYETIFDRAVMLDCIVIGHLVNRGKGFALKKGFGYAQRIFPGHDVVCAECDGEHDPVDILKVAGEVAAHPEAIVLGSRQFTGHVPAAGRFGNAVTRVAFARSTGRPLYDTQTGLRGYAAGLLPWLGTVAGDRFEYEMNVLLQAAEKDVPVHEVPIEAIYLEGNESSHFRPVVDWARRCTRPSS